MRAQAFVVSDARIGCEKEPSAHGRLALMQSEATVLVRALRKAYRAYLRGATWDSCEAGYRRLVDLVSSDARRAQLDKCIATAIDGGALVPARAIVRLRRQDGQFFDLEREFANQMGLGRRSHGKWMGIAIRQAKRLEANGQTLPGCGSAAALLALLADTHKLVKESGRRDGDLARRRVRVQTRKLALREVDRRLYVIGMLLANGEDGYRNVFNLSYALSSGVSAFPPKAKRRVPDEFRKQWCTWQPTWRDAP